MAQVDPVTGFLLGYSGETVKSYRAIMYSWQHWLSDNRLPLLRVEQVHIEAYLRCLEMDGASANTVRNIGMVLRLFYRYCETHGHVDRSPAEHIRLPKQYRMSTGTWLTRDEAKAMLDTAAASDPYTDALCCLYLLSGLRCSEALSLKVEDVDGDVIKVARKGHAKQAVSISDRTAAALTRAIGRKSGGYIFRSGGGRMLNKYAEQMIRELASKAGIDKSITPHSLRRSFCTISRDAGVPDRDIMASGGWTSPYMLDYYDMQRAAVDRNASTPLTDFILG